MNYKKHIKPLGQAGVFHYVIPLLVFIVLFGAIGSYVINKGHAIAPTQNPVPASIVGAITSGVSGKCLDNNGNSTANGNKVDVWACNGSKAQTWTAVASDSVSNLYVIKTSDGCLNVLNGGEANADKVVLGSASGVCPYGNTEFWALRPSEAEASASNPNPSPSGLGNELEDLGYFDDSGYCLADPNGSTVDGTQLQVSPCNGKSQQVWDISGGTAAPAPTPPSPTPPSPTPPTPTPPKTTTPKPKATSVTGAVTSAVNGKCMDEWGDSTKSGTKVDSYVCNSSAAQKWTVTPISGTSGAYTIKDHNLCLNATNGGITKNDHVDIANCTGGITQSWFKDGRTIRDSGAKTGLCLSDPDASTVNGTQLLVYTCNGKLQQNWDLPV